MPNSDFWTPKRIALLGTDSDRAIAKRLGVSPSLVGNQRRAIGIPAARELGAPPCKWGETELALMRSYTDEEVAKMTGRSIHDVAAKRRSL